MNEETQLRYLKYHKQFWKDIAKKIKESPKQEFEEEFLKALDEPIIFYKNLVLASYEQTPQPFRHGCYLCNTYQSLAGLSRECEGCPAGDNSFYGCLNGTYGLVNESKDQEEIIRLCLELSEIANKLIETLTLMLENNNREGGLNESEKT